MAYYSASIAALPHAPMPPPGLEDESTLPMKIAIPRGRGGAPAPPPPLPMAGLAAPPPTMQPCVTQGEWVNAVMAVTPYLDAQGVQQALRILDAAVENIERAKAVDLIVATSMGLDDPLTPAGLGGGPGGASASAAAAVVRAQIREQQQLLLQQLHRLRGDAIGRLATQDAQPPPQGPIRAAGVLGGVVEPTKLGAPQLGLAATAPPAMLTTSGNPPPQQQQLCLATGGGLVGAARGGGGVAAARNGGSADRFGGVDRFGAMSDCRSSTQVDGQKRGGDRMERQQQGRPVQTLSTSLQLLADEDPDCLFIVRRINKLGFKASRKLKQHFSYYGGVVKVLVAHSTVRQQGDPHCTARRRPSSLGFVHMAHAEAVRRILAQGVEHDVEGSLIRVQKFERQTAEPLDAEPDVEGVEDEDEYAYEPDMSAKSSDWARQQSSYSTVSTRTSASAAPSSLGEAEAIMLEAGGAWSF